MKEKWRGTDDDSCLRCQSDLSGHENIITKDKMLIINKVTAISNYNISSLKNLIQFLLNVKTLLWFSDYNVSKKLFKKLVSCLVRVTGSLFVYSWDDRYPEEALGRDTGRGCQGRREAGRARGVSSAGNGPLWHDRCSQSSFSSSDTKPRRRRRLCVRTRPEYTMADAALTLRALINIYM